MSKTLSGVQEVSSYLRSIGREDCFHAVVQQGFYTSMDALRGTTYEELVECGVRQAHAKLIVSSLGSGAAVSALAGVSAATELDEVAAFLRSVGLENCPPAWSNAPWCPTSALRLLRAHLTALGGSTERGGRRFTGRSASASAGRASRAASKVADSHCVCPPRPADSQGCRLREPLHAGGGVDAGGAAPCARGCSPISSMRGAPVWGRRGRGLLLTAYY